MSNPAVHWLHWHIANQTKFLSSPIRQEKSSERPKTLQNVWRCGGSTIHRASTKFIHEKVWSLRNRQITLNVIGPLTPQYSILMLIRYVFWHSYVENSNKVPKCKMINHYIYSQFIIFNTAVWTNKIVRVLDWWLCVCVCAVCIYFPCKQTKLCKNRC